MQQKLSDYVVETLERHGVKHVFLLTGGMAMHLNDSLGTHTGIQYVCNLHEQACSVAAEAYAKYDTRLGVAMVTAGPGSTNAVTGVAGAWLDSSPTLFLSGQVKTKDLKGDSGLRNRGVQEIDIPAIVGPITKYAVTVTDPKTIRFHLEKAIHLALHGRPGPVWVDIPLDVQASRIDPETLTRFTPDAEPGVISGAELKARVARVLGLLASAERPFMLVGNGVRLAGAQPQLAQVIERLAIPFGLTWPAMDLVPDTHPLLVGRPGPMASRGANFAMQNADLLLMVGARMDLVMTAFAPEKLARGATKVMVDIDPHEIEKLHHHVAHPICADAGDFLGEMLLQSTAHPAPHCGEWSRRCKHWKTQYPIVLPEHRESNARVSMFNFADVLSELLAEGDLVIPGSSGNAIETFLLAFRAKKGQRVFITTGLGPMGFGLPASIGGCLAHGRRRTICVDGDGGFQMNAQELETVARLNLPIKIFVINNDGYGSIVASQKTYFGRLVGADPTSGVTLPDVVRLAGVHGIKAHRIADQADLRRQLRDILMEPGPAVVDVLAIVDEVRAPRVTSVQRSDGTMVSKPLEDLWPFLDREEFRANMLIPPLED
jgi:acetolactate synthase I/II/III large subunit